MYIVLSVTSSPSVRYRVLHPSDTKEAAIEYIKNAAVKWVHDNVGINNYVDVFDSVIPANRPGFYVEYVNKSIRDEIVGVQIVEHQLSGWTGKYSEFTRNQLIRWVVVESDCNLVLASSLDKLSREVDSIIGDYRDAECDRNATIELVQKQFQTAHDNLSLVSAERDELKALVSQLQAEIQTLKTHRPYSLFTSLPSIKPIQSQTPTYDEVVNELKSKIASRMTRGVPANLGSIPTSAPPPPPPPPPTWSKPISIPTPIVAMPTIDWDEYDDSTNIDITTKTIDELLDDLDSSFR